MTRFRVVWLWGICLGFLGAHLAPPRAYAGEAQAAVAEILRTVSPDSQDPIWTTGLRLSALGESARPELEKALLQPPLVATRLAAAFALLKIGEGIKHPATIALRKIILDSNFSQQRRLEAAAILGTYGGDYANRTIRELLARNDIAERLRVELAKSLWKLTHGGTAYEELTRMMRSARSTQARAEAALALGRAGRFEEVKDQLGELATLPGNIGDQARTLLRLRDKVQEEISQDDFPTRLINEIIHHIRHKYAPDETDKDESEQLLPKNLATAAARALLHSIDPFSDYLDEETYREMEEQIRSGYGGIGAYVGMRKDRMGGKRFTILNPMYGEPAYQAGLKRMDIIEKIDGVDIRDMKLRDIIKLLKGNPNTAVVVSVKRLGAWENTRDFTVTRKLIGLPATTPQLLPGGIGYVSLSNFNSKTTKALKRDLAWFKREQTKGVILDLTNNPGGLLSAAVGVGRLFIGHGKEIVSSRGLPNVYPQQSFHAGYGDPFYTGPLVVMVNGNSASASEIVAGALRDHERAALVGEKTFGKGSVQQLIPIKATRGTTRIKLTIAKYYLPKGECIHGRDKGIQPHVMIRAPFLKAGEAEIRLTLREKRTIEKWVDKNFGKYEQKLRQLLVFDGFSLEKYPGAEDLRARVKSEFPQQEISREIIRKELRIALREYIRFNRPDRIAADPQEDIVLQRALVELGKKLEAGLPDLPLYNAFRHKFDAEDKLAAAAAKGEHEVIGEKEKPAPRHGAK